MSSPMQVSLIAELLVPDPHQHGKLRPEQVVLTNPAALQGSNYLPDYGSDTRSFLAKMQDFHLNNQPDAITQSVEIHIQKIQQYIRNIVASKDQLIVKLEAWEQRQKRNNLVYSPMEKTTRIRENRRILQEALSADLKPIKIWFDGLVFLIQETSERLRVSENLLVNATASFANSIPALTALTNLTNTVQKSRENLNQLIKDLLKHVVVVEIQPLPIYEIDKKKSREDVVVALLFGPKISKNLNLSKFKLYVKLRTQQSQLPQTDEEDQNRPGMKKRSKAKTVLSALKAKTRIDKIDGDDIISPDFKNGEVTFCIHPLKLKLPSREKSERMSNNGTSLNKDEERAMQKKLFLEFECTGKVGSLDFKVTTLSLPFVATSNHSQNLLAEATIPWYYMVGEENNATCQLRAKISASRVMEEFIIPKCLFMTGRHLTEDNVAALRKTLFGNIDANAMVTLDKICHEKVTDNEGRICPFSPWEWLHTTLKLIARKGTCVEELWKRGLLAGFIDRETATDLLLKSDVGMFILRFPISKMAVISISALTSTGIVHSSQRFGAKEEYKIEDLIPFIENKPCLLKVYQPNNAAIAKHEAFRGIRVEPTNRDIPRGPYTPLPDESPQVSSGESKENVAKMEDTSTSPMQAFGPAINGPNPNANQPFQPRFSGWRWPLFKKTSNQQEQRISKDMDISNNSAGGTFMTNESIGTGNRDQAISFHNRQAPHMIPGNATQGTFETNTMTGNPSLETGYSSHASTLAFVNEPNHTVTYTTNGSTTSDMGATADTHNPTSITSMGMGYETCNAFPTQLSVLSNQLGSSDIADTSNMVPYHNYVAQTISNVDNNGTAMTASTISGNNNFQTNYSRNSLSFSVSVGSSGTRSNSSGNGFLQCQPVANTLGLSAHNQIESINLMESASYSELTPMQAENSPLPPFSTLQNLTGTSKGNHLFPSTPFQNSAQPIPSSVNLPGYTHAAIQASGEAFTASAIRTALFDLDDDSLMD